MHSFYEFNKFAIDNLKVFDSVACKSNGFIIDKFGKFDFKIEIKPALLSNERTINCKSLDFSSGIWYTVIVKQLLHPN